MNTDPYKNYTSTSVLTDDLDVNKFTAWSHGYFKSVVLPNIPTDKNTRILEIGCGYGRYTSLLTNTLSYKNTTGIDISQEQIEFAREKFQLTNVIQADAITFLKNTEAKFDVIILMDVLEHLELAYSLELLTKIRESLTNDGTLIIQVPNGLSPLKPIFYEDVTHVRAFSPKSITQILRMTGFSSFKTLAIPPYAHSLKSTIHRIIWKTIINPLIYLLILLSHGNAAGGIYSSNILTIARK